MNMQEFLEEYVPSDCRQDARIALKSATYQLSWQEIQDQLEK